MEKIILLLIIALLNGSLVYIDSLLKDIIPISLYAEKYMTLTTGANLLENLYDIVFSFGVALMVLKFLKKGFEIYVLWTDGDPDEEPLFLLTNFFAPWLLRSASPLSTPGLLKLLKTYPISCSGQSVNPLIMTGKCGSMLWSLPDWLPLSLALSSWCASLFYTSSS